MMPPAFALCTPLPVSGLQSVHGTCSQKVTTVSKCSKVAISMGGRRDLKKEKQLRNFEFARAHRKRVPRFTNRRAAKEAIVNEDNEFLSSVYGTIQFKHGNDNDKEDSKS